MEMIWWILWFSAACLAVMISRMLYDLYVEWRRDDIR